MRRTEVLHDPGDVGEQQQRVGLQRLPLRKAVLLLLGRQRLEVELVTDLAPGTVHRVELTGAGMPVPVEITARTLVAPPGELVHRIATVSDTHIGSRSTGFLHTIVEKPEPAEALGWNGDAIEAEGFAYMAVRSLRGLPISFPGTTGAPRPLTGGTLHRFR